MRPWAASIGPYVPVSRFDANAGAVSQVNLRLRPCKKTLHEQDTANN